MNVSKESPPFYWEARKILAFLRRDVLFETSYKLQTTFNLLTLLFALLILYFMTRLVGVQESKVHLARYGGDYFTYSLVGLAFMGFFNAGMIHFATAIRQQLNLGVLEAMLTAPVRPIGLLFYSILWPMSFELAKALVCILVGALWLGARVALVKLPLFAAALTLSAIVFCSLGMIAASLIVYFKRGDPIAWIFSSLSFLAGGVVFPVSVLPGWLQVVAHSLPVTYALDALRFSLIPAAQGSSAARSLLVMLGFALVLFPAACWTASFLFSRARAQGSLGLY